LGKELSGVTAGLTAQTDRRKLFGKIAVRHDKNELVYTQLYDIKCNLSTRTKLGIQIRRLEQYRKV